jgi:hypothetical protein
MPSTISAVIARDALASRTAEEGLCGPIHFVVACQAILENPEHENFRVVFPEKPKVSRRIGFRL